MKTANPKLIMLLLSCLLAACATSHPLQYPDVVEPQAVMIEPVKSGKPLVALALGSGGDRGFAHVGVIKALEANGVHIDMVVGTSAGSVVGALYAGGYSGEEIERIALNLDEDRLRDVDLSRRGYIRGEQLQDFINRELKNRSIEQLDKPFIAVATKLSTGDAAAFNRGNTGMAVRASSSIPAVYHPVMIGGQEYVDGDLVNPVPVSVAYRMGADIVIAVDVVEHPKDNPSPQDVIDILKQSIRIMRQPMLVHALGLAQVVIHPEIGKTPELNADGKLRLIKSGEDAAIEKLPQIRELLKRIASQKISSNARNK